jgi:Spy/CpxP family protein refolding chaperone
MIRRVIGLVALLWLCAGPLRAAEPVPPPPVPGMAAMNLTAAQQKKLSDMESASHEQAKQLFDQIRALRDKLSDLYKVYSFDSGDARHLNHQLNHVQGQLLDLHLNEQQQLRSILTPEQFAQLQAAIQQHNGWDDHRRDSHAPDHPGPDTTGRGPGR